MALSDYWSKLKGFFKAPPAPPKLDRAALRGDEVSYVDSYLYAVEPFPYNPDDLVAKKGLKTYTEMGHDDQIKSALTIKKLAVLTSGYEIREPEYPEKTEKEQAASKEPTDFIQFCLEECDGQFSQKLLGVLTALNYGFSVSEVVYKAIDYGPFEGKWGLRDIKTRKPEGFDFQCFSADTELLTKDGWKLASALSKVDDVATLNPATDELEYQKPTRLYRYPYRGKMFHQTGKHVDFLVTPNHRLWVKKSKDTAFQLVEAQSLVGGTPAKLSHQDIEDIKSARAGCPRNERGELYRQIAERYGASAKYIGSVANGKFAKSQRVYDRAVYNVKRDCRWVGEERQFFTLPAVTSERVFHTGTGRTETVRYEYIKPEIQIPMDDWLSFFGIWLAEGWVHKAKKYAYDKGDSTKAKSFDVGISQNVGPNLDAIKRCVDACGFSYSMSFSNQRRHAQIIIRDLQLFTYLEQFGKSRDKFIPKELMQLSSRQLRILYDAMMMGDGHIPMGIYTSVSKMLADNVAELLIKIGYAATVHVAKNTRYEKNYGLIHVVHRSEGALNETACNIIANNARWVDYDGDVFCLEVPNHIVYARRNGKACWSGNSDAHGNLMPDGILQNRRPLQKNKFLLYSYNSTFSNHYGDSDLRAAYHCYSDDTEILTEYGWKNISVATMDERVATLNKDTGHLEYQYPSNTYAYPYRGKMFHQGGRFVDLLVTPNHNMWVAPLHNNKSYRFVEAGDMGRFWSYKRDAKWVGNEPSSFTLPEFSVDYMSANKYGPTGPRRYYQGARTIPMEAWLSFFGIWLAEGHTTKHVKPDGQMRQRVVGITQNRGKKLETIKKWVTACGFHFSESTQKRDPKKVTLIISNAALYEYLVQFGGSHTKFIPQELKELSPRLLKILYDAMMLGDGRRADYCTVSKRLADDVSEIIFKMGYAPRTHLETCKRFGTSIWIVGRNERSIDATCCNARKDRREWLNYDGMVYCLEVPNHLLYVRRNGKACWSGNSWWMKTNIMRFMFMSLERHGSPIIVFQGDSTLTEPQKTSMQTFINDLQQKSGIIVPKGITLDLKEPSHGAADAFIPVLKFLNDLIRIAILVPGLMGLSAEQQTGSLARSETEFDVFILVVKWLREDLESLINEGLVKVLVDLNYEVADGKYPRFKFKTITAKEKAELFKLWQDAVASHAVTNRPEDENRMRGLVDFDLLSDEEVDDMKDEAQANKDAELEQKEAASKGGGGFPFERREYSDGKVDKVVVVENLSKAVDAIEKLRNEIKDRIAKRSKITA